MIVEGHMQYVWDETGKRYLDAFAGIVTVSVGHCHPQIVEKVREQVGKLQHTTTIYLHPTIGQFGKKLAEKMPAGSGLTRQLLHQLAAARRTRSPILSAREFTGNQDVISLRNGYHGGTQVPMGLTAHGTWKFKTQPRHERASHAAPATATAARSGWSIPVCGVKCAHDIKNVIQIRDAGRDRLLHRRADPGRRRRGHAAAGVFSRSSTTSSASTAACASPTKCKAASAAPAITTGRFRTGASCPTWSRWPRASATARRSGR